MQVGQDARLAAGDDMVAQPREIAGAGAADVQPGRGPGAPRQLVGIDAQRRAARIDVGMEVDHAGHHDHARQVSLDRGIAVQLWPDRSDAAVGESHIGHGVDALAWIDQPCAAQQEIIAHDQRPPSSPNLAFMVKPRREVGKGPAFHGGVNHFSKRRDHHGWQARTWR